MNRYSQEVMNGFRGPGPVVRPLHGIEQGSVTPHKCNVSQPFHKAPKRPSISTVQHITGSTLPEPAATTSPSCFLLLEPWAWRGTDLWEETRSYLLSGARPVSGHPFPKMVHGVIPARCRGAGSMAGSRSLEVHEGGLPWFTRRPWDDCNRFVRSGVVAVDFTGNGLEGEVEECSEGKPCFQVYQVCFSLLYCLQALLGCFFPHTSQYEKSMNFSVWKPDDLRKTSRRYAVIVIYINIHNTQIRDLHLH